MCYSVAQTSSERPFEVIFSKTFALSLVFAFLGLLRPGYAAVDSTSLNYAFNQMYSLDFQTAHKMFENWQEMHPEDPLGPASNAAAYLFGEFERLHILEFDLFVQDRKLEKTDQLLPDPNIKAAFEGELARADSIAAKVLAQSSNDRNALFAKTLIDGLRGTYAALVEKKKRDALDFLKESRSNAEKLIAIDSTYYDAYLAIGIENYLLGIRSAPTRWVLRLSGAQTSKDKGLANIRITAEKGSYLAPYARLLLVIAYLRDHDRDAAKKLLVDLARDFPQNRLYQVELARLYN
jgi:hypothetical protein